MIITLLLPLFATDLPDPSQVLIARVALRFAVGVMPDSSPFPRWNRGLGVMPIQRLVTSPLIVGPISTDLLNPARHLLEQIRECFGIAQIILLMSSLSPKPIADQ